MPRLTTCLPDDRPRRLKQSAYRRGARLNKPLEELSTRALVETDAETHFRRRAARPDTKASLAVLDKLDRYFEARVVVSGKAEDQSATIEYGGFS